MKRIAALLLSLCVAGCAGLGAPRQADRYFILDGGTADATTTSAHVRVAPTTAAAFYDTQDIAFSRSAGTRAYYQFNHWTERPQRAIHDQLAARLGRGSPDETYVLVTHVNEIYHDAAQQPGTAHVSIDADLVDAKSRRIVASRSFTRSAAASSYDAPGAVHGFDDAVHAVLDDIVGWVRGEVAARERVTPTSAEAR